MKTHRDTRNRRTGGTRAQAIAMGLGALVLAGGLLAGGYWSLRGFWLDQSVIRDVAAQTDVTSGRLVKADAIREAFGLHDGANLATIDFAERRREALKRYPTLRTIDIERRLPNRVVIRVTEREPFVRLGLSGRKGDTGRVVDAEGVVFPCRRGTAALPIIYERASPGTPSGERLDGRARAALRLIDAARDPEFAKLNLQSVDTAKRDYLLATLGDASQAQIAWDDMDDPQDAGHASMVDRLRRLSEAVGTGIINNTKIWNATLPGRVSSVNRGR